MYKYCLPFGSQHVCSHSDLSPEGLWPADSALKRSYHCYFHYAREFATPILAHMLDSLVRVSRRGKENHFASKSPDQRNIAVSSVRKGPTSKATICTDPNPGWPILTHSASTASSTRRMRQNNTGFLRFPFNNFMYSLTLFSKFFSSFPHGTCSLSVSYQYLALDGIYHPLWAAIPNNSTRWRHEYSRMSQARTGVSPSLLPFSKGLGPGHQQTMLLQTTTRHKQRLVQIHTVSSSRFSRPYWGNTC